MDDRVVAEFRDVLKPDVLARAGLLVAEGRLVVQRLLASGRYRVRAVLLTRAAARALFDEQPRTAAPVHVVEQKEMDALVGFHIHRGCLAIAERPAIPVISEVSLADARRLVVLEGVANPDNIGGIFRSAAAFGVDLVVLGPGCGDPWYRKAIRTSMAATLDVPFVSAGTWPLAVERLRQHGVKVLALTAARDAEPLDQLPRRDATARDRLAIMLGAEGQGLSAHALQLADSLVHIRTSDRVDSLNVTVAASIAMHHVF